MSEIIISHNLIIAFVFLLMGIFLISGFEKHFNKLLYFLISGAVVLILLSLYVGIAVPIVLILMLFLFWVFFFGFNVNRIYIYILALVFLVSTPLLLIAKYDDLAEFFAILAFLMLVMGVTKDIFYEKMFREK
jgi:hypothetical protein